MGKHQSRKGERRSLRAAPKTKKNFSQLEKLLKTEEEFYKSKAGKPATVMQSKARARVGQKQCPPDSLEGARAGTERSKTPREGGRGPGPKPSPHGEVQYKRWVSCIKASWKSRVKHQQS